ncbi:hypothetical protein CYLTODRAFT_396636 [Cylindrobasidium torrendii FP15055 ss-10]|uniref:P-loop containing nucleoside triphosphate hydrolase protein n=1 Tax=Cylindrobasidium torrendii FP15055 ss-10 TaxID=1314674 RepID=A0A0D7BBV7_9AGAR|nr:hypothetical protein CYLTODRAFT_396636 [Cylindrobasidium torrendii FP15055 ss-10]
MVEDTLIPRRYQEDIFLQARDRNVIAALDTGSGKTYISVLLMKWIATQPSSYRKRIVFLAPKATLADQQAEFIAKHTSFRVLRPPQNNNIDFTDRVGWAAKWAQHDVVVLTHQTFRDMLSHSIWSLDKVSLLIFDECHHARKNHAYNKILSDYHTVPVSKRPRIFGMTASPVWDAKNPRESIAGLESNMDATIIGVRAHQQETTKLLNSSTTQTVRLYRSAGLHPSSCPVSDIVENLTSYTAIDDPRFEIEWDAIVRRHHNTVTNLGPFPAAEYVYRTVLSQVSALLNRNLGDDENLKLILDMLLDYKHFFEADTELQDEWLVPKVHELADLILQHASNSPNFQAIVFVDQRQTASTLSRILPRLNRLKDVVRCGSIQSDSAESVDELSTRNLKRTIADFRAGLLNLIVATNVGEEGLDFQSCELVIRFDKIHNLVGYIQSRGRARSHKSSFVVMAEQGDDDYIKKVQTIAASEHEVKQHYHLGMEGESLSTAPTADTDNAMDVDRIQVTGERYVVPRTNATLTDDTAIPLLSRLCALLDGAKPQLPVYRSSIHGDESAPSGFSYTLQLPRCLPLEEEHLTYHGPMLSSKKEAKRAVAFIAAKQLHELDVLDDYLLPHPGKKPSEDLDGRTIQNDNDIPKILNEWVRDPWDIDTSQDEIPLWLYPVLLDGVLSAALLVGTRLPLVGVLTRNMLAELQPPQRLWFDVEECVLMSRFTKQVVFYCNTGNPVNAPAAFYMVPIDEEIQPDFQVMEKLLDAPLGETDWSKFEGREDGSTFVRHANQHGRPYTLQRIRHDLTTMSVPSADGDSREVGFESYYASYQHRWSRKSNSTWKPTLPTDGPLLEVKQIPKATTGAYSVEANDPSPASEERTLLLAQGACSWFDLPYGLVRSYFALPAILRRTTDTYRARAAKFSLSLPPIRDDLMVQALTIPSAVMPFNNQRLETLGDSVLKICTVVHLFTRYPRRHEGQLAPLLSMSVSNRFLMTRALDLGLVHFITTEIGSVRNWRYTCVDDGRFVHREVPRRSLQDCMEATLGAAYLTGGIEMALRTGHALGMAFGGLELWSTRHPPADRFPVPPMFSEMQDALGYRFRNGRLLVQAVRHQSCTDGESYERLEFLGDAVVDIVVVGFLFRKFPKATSAQISLSKMRIVCALALSFIAVNFLKLHRVLLINQVDLSIAVNNAVTELESLTPEDVLTKGWEYRPPKVLCDVFESVIGAVFVDSGWDFERTVAVTELILFDLLDKVTPAVPLDPVTVLHEWLGKAGCLLKPVFEKHTKDEEAVVNGISVLLHDTPLLARPVFSSNPAISKAGAAYKARARLMNKELDVHLKKICTCRSTRVNKERNEEGAGMDTRD